MPAAAWHLLQGVVMAYVESTGDPKLPSIYNVNYPVGIISPNKRDDVFLVQWLLHRVYADSPSFTAPDGDDLDMDGWSGPKTTRWIRMFQTDVQKKGLSIRPDGRVDRAHAGENTSKTAYTIVWLNVYLARDNPSVFMDPSTDPEVPQELLSALANKSGADGPYQPAELPPPNIPT
jgi:hypothetical protein